MASEFIERNKRKSLLALLLLLLGGRGKYVAMLLVAGAVSIPFLLTGEKLERLLSFPAVSSALRAVGLASPEANLAPQPAGFEAQAANPKAAFWDRFLRAVNAPLPPAKTTTSTMAMLRGGSASVGPAVLPEKEGQKTPPGKVKGVVNTQERAEGEEAGGVDMAGVTGAGGPGGLDGDAMAQELGDRYGSAGPYANRTMLSGPGGAADMRAGVYNQVMNTAAEAVPAPTTSAKGNRLGKVSGFSWRSAKTKTSSAMGIKRARSNRVLPKLSEAFTMGSLAFDSRITPEYASAYSGAVFDGNAVDGDYLSAGDAIKPTVPSTAYAESMLANANQVIAEAEACSDSATSGAKNMENIGNDLQRVQDTMDPEHAPSKCCLYDGDARKNWDKKINGDPNSSDPAFRKGLYNMCTEMNDEMLAIAVDCPGVQGAANPKLIECGQYKDMLYNGCSGWSCVWEFFVWALGGLLLTTIWALGAITGWYDMGTPYQMMQGIVKWIMGDESAKPPEVPTGQETEKGTDLSGKS